MIGSAAFSVLKKGGQAAPLITQGVYIETADKPYEVEASYYLKFQVKSALVSIEYLEHCQLDDYRPFDSKAQYVHFYLDHLLYSMGQISARFIDSPHNKQVVKKLKQLNRQNFSFSAAAYPILSSKAYRNTIEHIDEHNCGLIQKYNGVGGFNFIDAEVDDGLIERLRTDRKTHPYTLDLLEKKIYIQRKDSAMTINIPDLKAELSALKNAIDSFIQIIN